MLLLFHELGEVLLDPAIDDAAVRAVSFAHIPAPVLQAAVAATAALIRPRQDAAIDFFGKRYSYLRQFVPTWLRTLTLHTQGPDDTVLRAVDVIRILDQASMPRAVPREAPMGLMAEPWRPYVRERGGEISRRYYELCTLWQLRSRPGRFFSGPHREPPEVDRHAWTLGEPSLSARRPGCSL